MQNIMLATDFSERSDRALRRAVLLARQHEARIELVHVVDDDRPRSIVKHETTAAYALLKEMARSLKNVEGVSCCSQVLQADPFAGIAKAVDDTGADLLVIGPHRRQILQDAFVGTTAERAIRVATCPILMVNGTPAEPYRNVLLTTDLTDSARISLQHFERLKLGADVRLTVLHVFDTPMLRLAMSGMMPKDDREAYVNDQRRLAIRELSDFMAKIGGVRAEQIVRQKKSSISNEILATAGDLKSDLIVVSTHGRGSVGRMLIGSVAERVLRSSAVDVLAIPPQRKSE
ncbi:universal stress protein [uncultured Sulfitobacter sp.]|uniref:universal stress protein n=1 Tax=uncultured Sulfitobacter sp. TaxID=191468 RepID=UPI002630CDE2|nr:universal stress protein [uncultured Sulfitobacter sp.]